jgi:hypothetical protein
MTGKPFPVLGIAFGVLNRIFWPVYLFTGNIVSIIGAYIGMRLIMTFTLSSLGDKEPNPDNKLFSSNLSVLIL